MLYRKAASATKARLTFLPEMRNFPLMFSRVCLSLVGVLIMCYVHAMRVATSIGGNWAVYKPTDTNGTEKSVLELAVPPHYDEQLTAGMNGNIVMNHLIHCSTWRLGRGKTGNQRHVASACSYRYRIDVCFVL